jgi:hypothetical protein
MNPENKSLFFESDSLSEPFALSEILEGSNHSLLDHNIAKHWSSDSRHPFCLHIPVLPFFILPSKPALSLSCVR